MLDKTKTRLLEKLDGWDQLEFLNQSDAERILNVIGTEYAENELKKDFIPSERVAIAKTIEKQIGKRQGQRTDQFQGKTLEFVSGKRTREIAAGKAGFGNDKTYRQAAKVVEKGTVKLIHAMDAGKVSISAASILVDVDPDEQDSIVELDEKAIRQSVKKILLRKRLGPNA